MSLAFGLAYSRWRTSGQPSVDVSSKIQRPGKTQVQENISPAEALDDALTGLCSGNAEQPSILRGETVRQLERIHALGRYHGDMKLIKISVRGENIILIQIPGGGSLRLRRWQQKDLACGWFEPS